MQQISPAEYFGTFAPDRVLIDVRSPGEFQSGHAPGARSLPLFDDAERSEVGTLYKQDSPDAALLRGLEIAGGKMRSLVEGARQLAPREKVTVQCWRGGQRSASVAWLLERAGMEVSQLSGGYKAYRTYARAYLAEDHHRLRVLSGPTGAGKTHVLRALREQGAYVVDLEGLACHKGSSFGALGEAPQPTTEQFENLLFDALRRIPVGATVWVEDESRMIGTVCQPDVFYRRLVNAPAIHLAVPLDQRVDNLVRDYACYPKPQLKAAFIRLKKRLGGQHVQTALDAVDRDDFGAAARVALVYYDKAYTHYASRMPAGRLEEVKVGSSDPAVIARQLLAR
jgi:tRNA 2-selenouridine synthase